MFKATGKRGRHREQLLKIELPVWFVSDAIAVYDRDDIDESIRAAGIKVRSEYESTK